MHIDLARMLSIFVRPVGVRGCAYLALGEQQFYATT